MTTGNGIPRREAETEGAMESSCESDDRSLLSLSVGMSEGESDRGWLSSPASSVRAFSCSN